MKRVLRLLTCCFAVILLSSTSAAPQGTAASEQQLAGLVADFPPFESSIRAAVLSGERKKQSARVLAEAPDSAAAVESLVTLGRLDEAVQAARRAIDKHAEASAAVINRLQGHLVAFQADGAHDYRPALRDVAAVARRAVQGMPREDAARLALSLLQFDNYVERRSGQAYYEPMKQFVTEYAGTQAAAEAELSLVSAPTGGRYDPAREAEAAAGFAQSHAGTCIGARALERVAFYAQHGDQSGRKGEDPTERFLRAFDLARQLERPEYARCDPKPNPISLVAGLYAYEPSYAPANIDRLLAAYRDFVISHFGVDADDPQTGIGYIILGKVGELYRLKGTGAEGLDSFLVDVENQVREKEVARFLRAMVPVLNPRNSMTLPSAALSAVPPQTVTLLAGISTSGTPIYRPKAAATLASLYRYYGDLPRAGQLYDQFVKAYPQSRYAWVAALRAGECMQEVGDWDGAAVAFQSAARMYASIAVARVIGHAWAGRAFEAIGQPATALKEYEAAAAAWDSDYGDNYYFVLPRKATAPMTFEGANAAWTQGTVSLRNLTVRVTQLKTTLAVAGGEAVERARWLIDQRKYKEVTPWLADFARKYPRSPNAALAQYLSHEARLLDALDTLNIEGQANETAGVEALEALIKEPYDFPVCAAKIARAIVLFTNGKQSEADSEMRAALGEWVARTKTEEPTTSIEKDVAAIRNLVFLPLGGPAYSQARGWNGFSWPAAAPPFLVVNREVVVKFAGGKESRVSLAQRFPGLDNVLQIDSDHLGILANIMNKLGGTKQREGKIFADKGVMETPSVPVGPSVNIIRFLATFFEARPGHWGGWEFLTYPVVSQIEFMDAAGTKARAKVTIGYGGCDVLLEKVDGAWKTTGLANMWVT